jgi:predicted nucleic acid-binding Zn ribbon protein
MRLRLKMDKSRKAVHIKEILNNILKENRFAPELKISKLKKKWLEIVGGELEKHITPVDIKKDVLFVNCDHQGWINTLQFFKSDILDNISKFFENEIVIKDIKFIFNKNIHFQ